jgi:hypothetical protein
MSSDRTKENIQFVDKAFKMGSSHHTSMMMSPTTGLLMRVNSTNVLDEGLRIGGIVRRMNSKVNQSNKVCIESKLGSELGLLSIYPLPFSLGPYI